MQFTTTTQKYRRQSKYAHAEPFPWTVIYAVEVVQ